MAIDQHACVLGGFLLVVPTVSAAAVAPGLGRTSSGGCVELL